MAGPHVGAAVLAGDEADVRDRGDELLRGPGQALADQVRPELARHLELLVDRDGLRRVDPAVRPRGRVVQLAQGGVAGAGVVPRLGALARDVRADSKTVTVQSGATTPRRAARVALMMPPPTSTTSGWALSGTALDGERTSASLAVHECAGGAAPPDRRTNRPLTCTPAAVRYLGLVIFAMRSGVVSVVRTLARRGRARSGRSCAHPSGGVGGSAARARSGGLTDRSEQRGQ